MRRFLGACLGIILIPYFLPAKTLKTIHKSQFDAKSAPNVLLITFDTTRADHLSCYGYVRRTSPTIDRLAAHGVLFENAYTVEPLTGPSHITMMTSLYPQQHGATINGMHMSTHPRPILLAQIFHRLGYKTAAFISAWTLRKSMTGLGRGFHIYNQNFTYHYKMVNSARRGNQVGAASRRWLRKHGHSRFFLWVHYFDPHEPYVLHPQFAHLPHMKNAKIFPISASVDAYRAAKIRAYDSEIAIDDNDLAKTFKLLDDLGVRDQTLIVFVADHGENLGEHGIWGHGYHINQQEMHVPLIFSYPKEIPQGERIKANVSTVDILPTILSYVGLHFRVPGQSGYSLKPMITNGGKDAPARPTYFLVYSEPTLLPPQWMSIFWTWAETKRIPSLTGFVEGNLKVVSSGSQDALRLYRLDDVFSQAKPVSSKGMSIATLTGYREGLDSWFKATNRGMEPQGHLSKEDFEMLKSLGYANP
ncbi:MAG: sulfatase [Acidobacteria bacterium]|nr:sulfatase [Acidobacteriota bacterium]